MQYHTKSKEGGGSSSGTEANIIDYDIVVRKYEFQFHYYVHFRINALGKRYEPPYPYVIG